MTQFRMKYEQDQKLRGLFEQLVCAGDLHGTSSEEYRELADECIKYINVEIVEEMSQRLSDITKAYSASDLGPDYLRNLDRVIRSAKWCVGGWERCQYQNEDGIQCHERGVRYVTKMWCCPRHAVRREEYFQ